MRSLYAAVNCRRPMRADGAWTSGSGRVGWPGDAPGATATGPFDLSMRELLLRPPYSISSAGRVSFHIDREGTNIAPVPLTSVFALPRALHSPPPRRDEEECSGARV